MRFSKFSSILRLDFLISSVNNWQIDVLIQSNYLRAKKRMRYDIFYTLVDTTVDAYSMADPENLCGIQSNFIDTEDHPLYSHCRNIREVEVAYERYRNFPTSDEDVQFPTMKVKVLRVDPAPDIKRTSPTV